MTRRVVIVKNLSDRKKPLRPDTPGLYLIPIDGIPTPTYSIARYQRGDILWVRETWRQESDQVYLYKADYTGVDVDWRSPLFLPRAAARLFLEIKDIRVERVQDITPEDAEAEGVDTTNNRAAGYDLGQYAKAGDYYTWAYQCLWNDLNAKRGYPWESNPYVWVYEFMRLT
jgi:hypothetical protein